MSSPAAAQPTDDPDGTVHLICGPARCGKSTIARHLRRSRGLNHIPLDAVAAAFQRSGIHPEIPGGATDRTMSIDTWVAALRRRDDCFAEFVVPLLERTAMESGDLVADGTLWPHHMALFAAPPRCVFVVDTSLDQGDRLIAIARRGASSNNWQREWGEERLRRWATYNEARSRAISSEAHTLGLPVVDLADFKSMADAGAAAVITIS